MNQNVTERVQNLHGGKRKLKNHKFTLGLCISEQTETMVRLLPGIFGVAPPQSEEADWEADGTK